MVSPCARLLLGPKEAELRFHLRVFSFLLGPAGGSRVGVSAPVLYFCFCFCSVLLVSRADAHASRRARNRDEQ